MANLRANKIVSTTGSNAITGSVEFDGTDDTLTIPNNADFNFGSGDSTIEMWVYPTRISATQENLITRGTSGYSGFIMSVTNFLDTTSGSNWDIDITYTNPLVANSWQHIAVCRNGNTWTVYINGIANGTATASGAVLSSAQTLTIGERIGQTDFQGFISNLRVIKGTALYTQDFIPPTKELKNIPGTVLLCCQDSKSATQEATGKTITVNGNATARNFSPQVGFDGYVEFLGPTKISTENYFYLPTGNTEDRGRGRGVIMGGNRHTAPTNPDVNTIFYIDIATQGNAVNFGELTNVGGQNACVSSSTRGISSGGNPSTPTYSNIIEFITIATTSNATDFGDLTTGRFAPRGMSSSTRGLFAGGRTPTYINTIDYITIASAGNSLDFGDLNTAIHAGQTGSSPTRGIYAGGQPGSSPFVVNTIDFVTIASTGDATDFGDLITDRKAAGSSSSSTRMVMGGGTNPALLQSIEYITIPTTGNSVSFGDLTGSEGRWGMSGMSNSIRGVFAGGYDPSPSTTSLNTMDFVTIASTGNAQDFGDVNGSNGLFFGQSCSDSHGGLG